MVSYDIRYIVIETGNNHLAWTPHGQAVVILISQIILATRHVLTVYTNHICGHIRAKNYFVIITFRRTHAH